MARTLRKDKGDGDDVEIKDEKEKVTKSILRSSSKASSVSS